MKDNLHREILGLIKAHAVKGTEHTSLDSYLGNSHPRYAISAPVLRAIAKTWMKDHKNLTPEEFSDLLTSLVMAESFTEKIFAGILLDYSTKEQRNFDPSLFDEWLNHLDGWAEVDAVCTNKYTSTHLLLFWTKWKVLLTRFSKDKNINKRRASLVFLCMPVRVSNDERLAEIAFANIERLKSEKDGLITKAISWLLRSMVKHHRKTLQEYLRKNADTLPSIAVRETKVKLETGKKTKSKLSG